MEAGWRHAEEVSWFGGASWHPATRLPDRARSPRYRSRAMHQGRRPPLRIIAPATVRSPPGGVPESVAAVGETLPVRWACVEHSARQGFRADSTWRRDGDMQRRYHGSEEQVGTLQPGCLTVQPARRGGGVARPGRGSDETVLSAASSDVSGLRPGVPVLRAAVAALVRATGASDGPIRPGGRARRRTTSGRQTGRAGVP